MQKLYIVIMCLVLCLVACTAAPVVYSQTARPMPITTRPAATSLPTPSQAPLPKAAPTSAPSNTPDGALRVLFIGNSYTFYNNLPHRFAELARSGGYTVQADSSANGGWSLSRHLESPDTTRKIAQGGWDAVVLQEQSVHTDVETGMYPAIRELHTLIESASAETILFITWGRRDGLPEAGYPDYAAMQAQVAGNYFAIGQELGLRLAPVGLAWQRALELDPALDLWDADGSHPSPQGTYLAACVFYSLITGESPQGLEYMAGLPEDVVALLQQAAADTVENYR